MLSLSIQDDRVDVQSLDSQSVRIYYIPLNAHRIVPLSEVSYLLELAAEEFDIEPDEPVFEFYPIEPLDADPPIAITVTIEQLQTLASMMSQP